MISIWWNLNASFTVVKYRHLPSWSKILEILVSGYLSSTSSSRNEHSRTFYMIWEAQNINCCNITQVKIKHIKFVRLKIIKHCITFVKRPQMIHRKPWILWNFFKWKPVYLTFPWKNLLKLLKIFYQKLFSSLHRNTYIDICICL